MTNPFAKKLGIKKESSDAPNPEARDDAQASSAGESAGSSDSTESPSVQAKAAPEKDAAPKPANPFAARKGSGDATAKKSDSVDTPDTGAASESTGGTSNRLAKLKLGADSAGSKPASGATTGDESGPISSLDALQNLDLSGPVDSQKSDTPSGFADETLPTKPTRELPEDMTTEELGFIDSLDTIYEVMGDADMLSATVRNIMHELQANEQYMKHVTDTDVRTLIRGMRESMGLAKIKKETKKKTRSKKAAKTQDMLADLDSLGINLDG